MSLTSSFVASLAAIQVTTVLARFRAAPAITHEGLLAMRQAMLDELQSSLGEEAGQLRVRILRARGADDLWHLRLELMDLLARDRGEPSARGALGRVDALLRRHWRGAPVSRPAGLR